MADVAPLASLSITHVYYDPSDKLSLACAYLALIPQGLVVVYTTLLFATREAEVALMFAGQLACEALNFVLKRLIKEERPSRLRFHGKGYGMPSSHAQFVLFWAVYGVLFVAFRKRRGASKVEGAVVSVVCCVAAVAVAASRVYLGYHTVKQVLVGSAAGAMFAVVWFGVVGVVRGTGLLAWAMDTPLARAAKVRDLLVDEDFADAGWERWQAKKRDAVKSKTK